MVARRFARAPGAPIGLVDMPEPTLKDVLAAIARLEKGQGEIRTEVVDVRADVVDLRAEMVDLRAEMKEGFAAVSKQLTELDADLDAHMKVHRELEKDIVNLKRRPPRTAARPARRGR